MNLKVWLRCEGKVPKVLECYQCESLSNQTEPLCDEDFWRLTTPSEKNQFRTLCPRRRSAFCMKLVVWHKGVAKTTRGCFNHQDSRGVQLRVGCSRSIHEGDRGGVVCMCNTRLCNGVAANLASVYVAGLVLLVHRFS